jgi:hypothetical protein
MTCTMLVPVQGLMEVWNYDKPGLDVLTDRHLGRGAVRVELSTDGRVVAKALFNPVVDAEENPRARLIIEYLIGAHLVVTGPLVLEGMDERVAIEIMRDVVR